jgi:hypothetical protein
VSAERWSLWIRGAEHSTWHRLGELIRVDVEAPSEDGALRREPLETHLGQWALRFELPPDLAADPMFVGVLETTLVRIGLLPTWMPDALVVALRDPEPLGLVTDTNALSLGSFGHALRVRGSLPTHAGIPDQVYMELHKQREMQGISRVPREPSSSRPTIGERARSRAQATAAARVVRRLGVTHVLHVARPPDPLVRFLGSSVGSPEDDEDPRETPEPARRDERHVGATVQRDRLILEAVRAHRAQLGRTKVWLITNDAKFAAHASLEGFEVALCDRWRAWSRTLVTSPLIDPWGLSLHHVPLQTVLEEFAWVFGEVAWARMGTKRGARLSVPEGAHEQMLLECDAGRLWRRLGAFTAPDEGLPPPSAPPSVGDAPTVESPMSGGPTVAVPHRRAPSAGTTVSMMVDLHEGRPWSQSGKERRRHTSFLRALGWIEGEDDHETLTVRGRSLAHRWRELIAVESVEAWAGWLQDAARDVARLDPQVEIGRALAGARALTSLEELATSVGWSQSDVDAQVRFGHAFGVLLQWQQGVLSTPWRGAQAARDALLAEVGTLLGGASAIGGVRVGELLVAVQNRLRMGLPAFRAALASLVSEDLLSPGGATEDTGDGVGALIPRDNEGGVAEYRRVDLRRGDWILPGRACQVVTFGRGAR